MTTVTERVRAVLRDIPPHVTVVAAAKGAPSADVFEVIQAGIRVIGHNHVAEARLMRSEIVWHAEWHYLGRLRLHSVRASALALFDVMQSVDSLELAARIDAVCERTARRLPILIEVNSGREPQKAGVLPEEVERVVRAIAPMRNVNVVGMMTMGPVATAPNDYRPCFSETHHLFQHIKSLAIPGVSMQHLSMGMSDSFRVAIEEGATMVRLGTILFGRR